MLVPVYVRIGKGRNGFKAAGALRANPRPLEETIDGVPKAIPTIELKLNIALPANAFKAAELELGVRLNELGISAEIA